MKRSVLLIGLLFFIGSISDLPAQSVKLLFPDNNEELTDIAVAFKAEITSSGPYILYASQNQDFSGTVKTHNPVNDNGKTKDDKNVVYFLTLQGKLNSAKKWMLTPGVWYWKISGDGGATFSETRKLTVNNERRTVPTNTNITHEKPLFHGRMRFRPFDYPDPAGRLARIVPDEIKDVVVLDLGHSFNFLMSGRSLFEYSKLYNDAGYKFVFDLGVQSRVGRIASMGEMEKVFRELPNCMGACTTEMNYYYNQYEEDNSMIYGTLELCKKYGKKFILADMNWRWNKWQLFNYQFYNLFMSEQYSEYFIPQYKTTDPWGAYTCISSVQGMKLAGMAKNYGVWSDDWCWEKFGQVNTIELTNWMAGNGGGEKVFPFIQHIKQYIHGITYGSTVFSLESSFPGHWETGEPNDMHYRYLLPFIKAVKRERIIPREKAITDNFNVVVDTEYPSSDLKQTQSLTYMNGNIWGDFLRSTYGISDIDPYNTVITNSAGNIIEAAYLEMIPNSDRYPSGIPFLPKPYVPAPVVDGRTLPVIRISDLNSKTKVDTKLNKFYPESENEAFAVRIDSSFFVFNTYENHDIRQHYKLDIQFAGIDSLFGDIDLLNYVIGRIRPDKKTLFFQCNGYVKNTSLNGGKYTLPTYPSTLKFKCQMQPTIESDEMAAISSTWDENTKIFSVTIDHTTAGAVDFTVTGSEDIKYDAASIQINPDDPNVVLNSTVQLTAAIYPETLKGVSVVWQSLSPGIASVSAKGLVSGHSIGSCQIIAKAGGKADTCVVKVGYATPVVEYTDDDHLVFPYPNPVEDFLHLSGIDDDMNYAIYSLSGFKIVSGNKQPINVSNLAAGVYAIEIKTNTKVIVRKFVKGTGKF